METGVVLIDGAVDKLEHVFFFLAMSLSNWNKVFLIVNGRLGIWVDVFNVRIVESFGEFRAISRNLELEICRILGFLT